MQPMSTLKLGLAPAIAALAITLTLAGTPARAESKGATQSKVAKDPPSKVALVAPPAPPPTVALVDKPRAANESDAPPSKPAGSTTWWPWVVVAAGAAGVAATIFLASGRDPSCPSGRVCQ
jgi:hypothetical protein